jgi:hypothetical protein
MGRALLKGLAKAEERRGVSLVESVFERIESLSQKVESVIAVAETKRDHKLVLAAVREARGNLALLSEVLVSLKLTRAPDIVTRTIDIYSDGAYAVRYPQNVREVESRNESPIATIRELGSEKFEEPASSVVSSFLTSRGSGSSPQEPPVEASSSRAPATQPGPPSDPSRWHSV